MARRPFFSGNYGSALGSFDTAAKLIAQAGQTQGQAMANIGKQIGDTIEEYQLNKVKREAEERTAVGNLSNFSPEDLLLLEKTNPQLGKAVQNLIDGKGGKKDVDLINAGTAPFIAARGREREARLQESIIQKNEFENEFNKKSEEAELLRKTLENEGRILLNKLRKTQEEVASLEKDMKSDERDMSRSNLNLGLEQKRLELEKLLEEVKQKRNSNSIFAELQDRDRTKFSIEISEAMSRLAINAEQLDQLRASRDVDKKTKEENLKILEVERKKLEEDLKNKQKLMQLYSSDSTEENLDFIKEIDIDDSFQGGPLFGKDAAGLFYNIVGGLGSVFGADITPETTGQAQNLLTLETFLLPALVKDISSRASNFTLQVARQKIPLPSDRDDVGQRKIEQLIPDLKLRLKEAQNTLASGETDKPYYQEARTQESRIRKIIPILENSLKEKSPSPFSGTTSTNVKYRILGEK